jgi:ribosomal protein S12 methylthiotransferase
MQTQLTVSEELNSRKIGTEITVITDGYDTVAEIYFGRSEADAPDVDGKIYFTAPKGKYTFGDFVKVKITEALDYDLIGEEIV